MLGRIATYVVPSVAVAVTALVLLGPGGSRPAIGARVRGIPVSGSRFVALRVEGVRRIYGVDDAAELDGVRVEGRSAGGELAIWEGALGSDGVADANLAWSKDGSEWIDLRVSRGASVLAEGRIGLRPPLPTRREPGRIDGTSSGDLVIRVSVARGYLAAPFWDALRVEVEPPAVGPRGSIGVDLDAPGAELSATHVDGRDDGGRAIADVRVSPRAHNVELTVRAKDASGRAGRWEGYLPIRPGAMWIDPARSDVLAIRSPSPRDRAYVSIEGPAGRLFGAVVRLAPDATGVPSGELPIAALPALAGAGEGLFAVVAGDPYEQGSGAIAWPLRGTGRVFAPALELLVDGVPAAEARESARARSARRTGMSLIAIAAVLEVLLLVLRSRASQAKLEAHLGRAFAEGDAAPVPDADRAGIVASARASPVLQIAVFAALIALAFALVAAASTFR